MSNLYRFEIAFGGEPQGGGLFQRLGDTGISPVQEDELCELFKDLPEVNLSEFAPLEFWFKEAGLRRFANAILEVDREISEHYWYLMGYIIEEDVGNPIYEDRWQIAFSKISMTYKGMKPIQINSVYEFLLNYKKQ